MVDLSSYAEKIYLVVRGDTLRGDQITQDEVKGNAKVEIIYGALPEEVLGDQFVTGLRYKDKNTNEVRSLAVDGIFVEIGAVPNSEIMGGLVKLNQFNEVVIDHKTGATSKPGIYAAGDVTDEIYKQNNISAGDAVKAALAAYNYLLKREKMPPAAG